MVIRCVPNRCPTAAGFLLVAITLLFLSSVDGAVAQEDNPAGQVVLQQGPVTAVNDGVPRSLYIGAPLRVGDRIVTRAGAKVRIEFQDGSALSVGENTNVELSAYVPDGGRRGVLTLLLGIVRTSLSGTWIGGFEVRTRAAVASVRSTDWITEMTDDRASVFVIEGTVAVDGVGDGSQVVLEEGFGTDIEIGNQPSAPKEWGRSRIDQALARTRLP